MTWSTPNTFATQSGNVPASQLDTNFSYVPTAIQQNSAVYAVDTGITNAYAISLTPSPTIQDGVGVKFRASSTNTSQPTLSINGGTAYNIYLANGGACPASAIPSGATVDVVFNGTFNNGAGGWELLYLPSAGGVTASGLPASIRQTVQSGPVNSSGQPSHVTTGSGLLPGFNASSTSPVVITYANNSGASGQVDIYTYSTSAASWSAVPSNNTSFLYGVYASPTLVSLGSTLAPPQYGYTYNQTAQSSLTLNNISTDDFGNTWTNSGVTFTNSSPMYPGTYMGVFNGAAYLKNTSITSLYAAGNSGFTLRVQSKAGSLTAAEFAFTAQNAANYGTAVGVNTSGKTTLFLSSTGTSWDVANGTTGTATLAANTAYNLELTQDPVAGKYYLYVNGVLDQTVVSTAKICSFTMLLVGTSWNGSTYAAYWTGNLQGFEFLPYCLHPAGVTFTPQTSLSNVAAPGYSSDWFNTETYVMYTVSGASSAAGTNPSFTQVYRCYLGECITGSSSVTSVSPYAYNGRYDSGLFPVSANGLYSKNHNLGSAAFNMDNTMADDANGLNERWGLQYYYVSASVGWYPNTPLNRNTITLQYATYVGAAASGGSTITSAYARIRVRRAF